LIWKKDGAVEGGWALVVLVRAGGTLSLAVVVAAATGLAEIFGPATAVSARP
jgi:hypothetical protein